MFKYLLVLVLISCAAATTTISFKSGKSFVPHIYSGKYYCGNTHTHTLQSDGDSEPEDVIAWYRKHGYDFLVMTDHNKITSTDYYQSGILVIPGEELTAKWLGTPVHVNALNIETKIEPHSFGGITTILQKNIDAIRAAGGVPHINHPNWKWALEEEHLYNVNNYKLFEIYNGADYNNFGDQHHLSTLQMWDNLLTSGKLLYGIATDDAHHFKKWGKEYANPGRGWVCVESDSFDAKSILQSLESGRFYSSTGIVISKIEVTKDSIEITSDADTALFVGTHGKILGVSTANPAKYALKETQQYVRIELYKGNRRAWTQPIFLK